MAREFLEADIEAFVAERKPIVKAFWAALQPAKAKHRPQLQKSITLRGQSGNRYRLYTRQNPAKLSDFSTGLLLEGSPTQRFMLIRCNGHQNTAHDNILEQRAKCGVQVIPPNTFHVHRATERYWKAMGSVKLAHYAEPTTEYFSLMSAVDYLIETCGFYFDDSECDTRYPLFHQEA